MKGLAPVLDTSGSRAIAPLGTFTLPSDLDGARGSNRASRSCLIGARNDLEAIDCYLAHYDGQEHTQRAYRKELERLVLWCAFVAGKPMSSLLVADCEAYAIFLSAPPRSFCGPKAPRGSARWRPFTLQSLSGASQKMAVGILRLAFEWLVKVGYLDVNPWVVVKDPAAIKRATLMKIERALPEGTWSTVVRVLSESCDTPAHHQDRAALVAILLMGDSGLCRAEVARAERSQLRPSPDVPDVWILTVLGRHNIARYVPVSLRTVTALRAHLRDRGLDFDNPQEVAPLLRPIVIPATPRASKRHGADVGRGYHPNSLYCLVVAALRRVRDRAAAVSPLDLPILTPDEIMQLASTSPNAFRHTFGALAIEKGMPLVVTQEIMGHASVTTTTTYAHVKEARVAQEAARLYRKGSQTSP